MASAQCLSEVKFCKNFSHTLSIFLWRLTFVTLGNAKGTSKELNVALCFPYELVVLVFYRLKYKEQLVSSGKGVVLILFYQQ